MGTCFIEFDRFDRMETCLKKYHHSVFPDGKKKEGRKINIELRYAIYMSSILLFTNIDLVLEAAATAKTANRAS
jgi:hypothetical protein